MSSSHIHVHVRKTYHKLIMRISLSFSTKDNYSGTTMSFDHVYYKIKTK